MWKHRSCLASSAPVHRETVNKQIKHVALAIEKKKEPRYIAGEKVVKHTKNNGRAPVLRVDGKYSYVDCGHFKSKEVVFNTSEVQADRRKLSLSL